MTTMFIDETNQYPAAVIDALNEDSVIASIQRELNVEFNNHLDKEKCNQLRYSYEASIVLSQVSLNNIKGAICKYSIDFKKPTCVSDKYLQELESILDSHALRVVKNWQNGLPDYISKLVIAHKIPETMEADSTTS